MVEEKRMSKIIDYTKLEVPIDEIESILSDYDMEEAELILKVIIQRRAADKAKTKQADLTQTMMDKFLPKGFKRGLKDKEGEI